MKAIKSFLVLLLIGMMSSCNEGIDPITPVAPGPDQVAPYVIISYPLQGALIQVKEAVTSINFQVEATDAIEIASVVLNLDGTEIVKYTEFKDYRAAKESFLYTNLTNGSHTLLVTATDLSGKSTSQSVSFEKAAPYVPLYDGEIFYMPFDGHLMDLVSVSNATKVGSSSFATGKIGKAYTSATDGYITFPTKDSAKGINLLNTEFSATFWYKVNATPARAGILTISAPDAAAPAAPNNRNYGFRFFREGDAASQTVKLNAGFGTGETWFDGGATASLNPATAGWVHMAFTISATKCVVYFNGEVVKEDAFAGIKWDGCDLLSIGSGAPRFTGWEHLSDLSSLDELRFFKKALTQTEVRAVMNGN